MQTFARWVLTPENRSARAAAGHVAECVCSGRPHRVYNPLVLYGPPGTGKTHLASALVADAVRRRPDLTACVVPAAELAVPLASRGRQPPEETDEDPLAEARHADLLVVEDLQHLPPRAAGPLAQLFDERQGRGQQMVFTANAGPGRLPLPARLAGRLASGLVVGLATFSPAGRLAFLQDRASRRQLAVGRDVLAWLAEHAGGSGRQLEGALARVEALARLTGRLPDVAAVAEQFRTEAEAAAPTVERIVQRVSGFFQVEPRQLQSRRRHRQALLPRQVGMYLARRLTRLSLEQIGAHFGGRDHSTVLHACRKVERALAADPALSGAVRQLHADLA